MFVKFEFLIKSISIFILLKKTLAQPQKRKKRNQKHKNKKKEIKNILLEIEKCYKINILPGQCPDSHFFGLLNHICFQLTTTPRFFRHNSQLR